MEKMLEELKVKTFEEIVTKNLEGIWRANDSECSGIMLYVKDGKFKISHMKDRPKLRCCLEDLIPIPTKKIMFKRVREMYYEEALEEFVKNNAIIKSPEIVRKIGESWNNEELDSWGGNVFSALEGEVYINNIPTNEIIESVITSNLISEEEKSGKWLVF